MKDSFEWIVVGAGPGGIASVGKLLDAGIAPNDIAWLDPQFKVGDFGTSWRHVSSNTSVEFFIKFYQDCNAFLYSEKKHKPFMIENIAPNKTCPLIIAAEPLHWITQYLTKQVNTFQDEAMHLTPTKSAWQLHLRSQNVLHAKKIILALGANAKELHFEGIPSIPLKTALNLNQLQKTIHPNDHIMVFGSAQSAKSVVENLLRIQIKNHLLFYRSENSLTRHFDEHLLESIDTLPITPQNLLKQMPQCTKAIYAIGFERRHLPIQGLPQDYDYDKKTGEIAPGVFGIGMAFPEIRPFEWGQMEYRVSAIWPFMKRLKRLLPYWLT